MAKEQSEIPTLKELIDSDQRLRSLRTRNAQAVMASELYDIPIDIFIQRKECSKSGVWRAKRQTKLGYNIGRVGRPQSLSNTDERILVGWIHRLLGRDTIVFTSTLLELVCFFLFAHQTSFIQSFPYRQTSYVRNTQREMKHKNV